MRRLMAWLRWMAQRPQPGPFWHGKHFDGGGYGQAMQRWRWAKPARLRKAQRQRIAQVAAYGLAERSSRPDSRDGGQSRCVPKWHGWDGSADL